MGGGGGRAPKKPRVKEVENYNTCLGFLNSKLIEVSEDGVAYFLYVESRLFPFSKV